MEKVFGILAKWDYRTRSQPAITEYPAYLFGLPFTKVCRPDKYPEFTNMAFKPPPYSAPVIKDGELYKEWASGEYVTSMDNVIEDTWEPDKTRGKSALSLVDFWGSTLEPAVFDDYMGRYTMDMRLRTPHWRSPYYWQALQDLEEREARQALEER